MKTRPDSALATVFPSPNHGDRNDGLKPEMVILHYTGMPSAQSALKWLCTPESSVSCHYFVYETGKILQLVPESRRAWHAGAGAWKGREDINSRSIGIEIANMGHDGASVDPDNPTPVTTADKTRAALPPFPQKQIEAVVRLVDDIVRRNGMAPSAVLAHSDIAPRRKRDPGEAFPWKTLAEAGLGLWVEPTPIRSGHFWQVGDAGAPVSALQEMLKMLGFSVPQTETYDVETADVVRAFQRHWRPEKVDGIADFSTITTLRDVLRIAP